MATNREERMQQRMRGAQRHQVQDAAFDLDLFFPAPELAPEPESEPTEEDAAAASSAAPVEPEPTRSHPSPAPETEPEPEPVPVAIRAGPSTSAKRRRLDGEDGRPSPRSMPQPVQRPLALRDGEGEDEGEEEQVDESPMEAPGSGRRRPVAVGAAADRTAVLHHAFSRSPLSKYRSNTGKVASGSPVSRQQKEIVSSSSPPPPRRAAKRASDGSAINVTAATAAAAAAVHSLLPSLSSSSSSSSPPAGKRRRSPRLLSRDVGGSEDELSPELASAVNAASTAGTDAAALEHKAQAGRPAGSRTSLFSKLAHARRSAASTDDSLGALDELLSSPSLLGVEPLTDVTNASVVPSSSPLARKSAATARSARTGSRLPGRAGLRRRTLSSTASPAVAAQPAPTAPVDDADRDELSPEQQYSQKIPSSALPSSQPSHTRRTAEVPSSSPPSRQLKRRRKRSPAAAVAAAAIDPITETVEEGEEQAEAIDEAEAARTIGRKRPRRSNVHEPSPELGSDRNAAEAEGGGSTADTAALPVAKRRRRPGPQQQSPAVQKQPRPPREKVESRIRQEREQEGRHEGEQQVEQQEERDRQEERPTARTRRPRMSFTQKNKVPAAQKKRKRRHKEVEKDREEEEEEEGGGEGAEAEGEGEGNNKTTVRPARKATERSSGPPVPITVQRFSRRRRRSRAGGGGDDGDDADGGDDNSDGDDGGGGGNFNKDGEDIPYANRSGVNVIDVLAQVCEDIIEQKLQEAATQAAEAKAAAAAGDSGALEARRDALTRQQALEAFREELRVRLLAQASAVDAVYALRRRVRAAHRQKLALREEILRIRAEREQVALRMDALRARHQVASKRAMLNADISATMHDIDLAVDQGRAAPDLTAAQQKTADLGNLELTVSRVTEQLCGGSSAGGNKGTGGVLRQIMDFNAFLERAAAMLEGRKTAAAA